MEEIDDIILFSVITVSFNSIKTIEHTFQSLIGQSFKNFEYIVIDGKSTDGTVDIIRRYESKFLEHGIQMKWVSEPDHGIYDAMNIGLGMCSGNIIGILNSDDIYMPWTLETVSSAVVDNPEVDVYHGICRFVSEGKITMIRALSSNRLKNGMIEHPTCFVRKRTYDKFGIFNTMYRFVADYDLMLRIKLQGGTFYLIESILAQFDEKGGGNSKASRLELLKLQKHYHLLSKMKLMFNYIKIYIKEFNK